MASLDVLYRDQGKCAYLTIHRHCNDLGLSVPDRLTCPAYRRLNVNGILACMRCIEARSASNTLALRSFNVADANHGSSVT
jgi:hypothetical protein